MVRHKSDHLSYIMSGRLFKQAEPISALIAPIIQENIIKEIKDIYPNIECLAIGSVGKRNDNEFNGDIDIAIKCKDINTLNKIVSTVFNYVEDTVLTESLYIISIKYPYTINDNDIKYVQVDFMNIWDIEYAKFRYYCPDYRLNESKYKVGQKIMFANMILNHTKEKYDGLEKNCLAKFDFRPTALFRYYMNINDNILHEKFITYDVNTIVNMCFNDGNKSHFNSIETLWEAIHSEDYKYPEEVKDLEFNFFINCWKKGWTNIVPEDFKLKYWTNEQIWNAIHKQSNINKINNVICNLSNMENK